MKRSARRVCAFLLAVGCAASLAFSQNAEPKPVNLWPGTAPGEKGDIGPEHDTTKADPNITPDKYVIRLGDVSVPTLTVFKADRQSQWRGGHRLPWRRIFDSRL